MWRIERAPSNRIPTPPIDLSALRKEKALVGCGEASMVSHGFDVAHVPGGFAEANKRRRL
jgi:hypothetical protein